jgi:hypothetical protein
LIVESRTRDLPDSHRLLAETDELIRIFITVVKKRKRG